MGFLPFQAPRSLLVGTARFQHSKHFNSVRGYAWKYLLLHMGHKSMEIYWNRHVADPVLS